MGAPPKVCPDCKFENLATQNVCLMCKSPLINPNETVTSVSRPPPVGGRTTQKTMSFAAMESAPQPTTAISSDDIDMATVVGWLCCEPLAPIPLVPGAAVSVGRSPECDLVLRDRSISRRQGVITAHSKDNIMFEDEGSANGTFLNGKRTSKAVLAPGDVLSFGPYEVQVHSSDSMANRDSEIDLGGTQVIEVASMTSGFLSEGSLAELLQGLEFNEKTGTLKLMSGSLRGTLVIVSGRAMWAILGPYKEEEAVYRMLEINEGRYTFTSEVEDDAQRIGRSITGMLLEATRRKDQAEGE